jgi:hypothetical protein
MNAPYSSVVAWQEGALVQHLRQRLLADLRTTGLNSRALTASGRSSTGAPVRRWCAFRNPILHQTPQRSMRRPPLPYSRLIFVSITSSPMQKGFENWLTEASSASRHRAAWPFGIEVHGDLTMAEREPCGSWLFVIKLWGKRPTGRYAPVDLGVSSARPAMPSNAGWRVARRTKGRRRTGARLTE